MTLIKNRLCETFLLSCKQAESLSFLISKLDPDPPVATTAIFLEFSHVKRLYRFYKTDPHSASHPPHPSFSSSLNLLRPQRERESYWFHGRQRFLSTEVTDGACECVLFLITLIYYSHVRTHKQLPALQQKAKHPLRARLSDANTPQPATQKTVGSFLHSNINTISCKMSGDLWFSIINMLYLFTLGSLCFICCRC